MTSDEYKQLPPGEKERFYRCFSATRIALEYRKEKRRESQTPAAQ